MNLKEAIYLTTAIICLESAFYAVYLNRKALTNIVYTMLTADFAIISFILYKISGAGSYSSCMWWYNTNTIPGCLVPPLSLHLSLCITENKILRHPCILPMLYIPAFIFIYLMSYEGFFRSECQFTNWGWETVININTKYAYIFILYANLSLAASAGIIIHWRYSLSRGFKKIHAKSILLPYLAGIGGMFMCPYFLDIDKNDFMNMIMDISGHILFVIFVIGMRYSIYRYSFMKITSMSSVSAIINGLSEPAFLLDVQGNIIYYNRQARELMGGNNENIIYFYEIFDSPVILKTILNDLVSHKESRSNVKCGISLDNKNRNSFCINFQSICNDVTGETTGVLVFLKEDLSINIFREKYGITERQMEIVSMIISGMTNREIAARAGLAEKTVENHLFNIYNKLSIDNKIELYNLANKFNIISN